MQNNHHKEGIVRIVFGFILVFLQILAYFGNSLQKNNFNIINLIGFNIPIIVGLFLLYFGFSAYSTSKNKYEEEIKKEKHINHQFSSNNREFSQKYL